MFKFNIIQMIVAFKFILIFLQFEKTTGLNIRERNLLVIKNYGLIPYYIKKKYSGCSSEVKKELFQEGSFGLVKAAEKFDPSYKNSFSTYAYYYINGYMLNCLRKNRKYKHKIQLELDCSFQLKKKIDIDFNNYNKNMVYSKFNNNLINNNPINNNLINNNLNLNNDNYNFNSNNHNYNFNSNKDSKFIIGNDIYNLYDNKFLLNKFFENLDSDFKKDIFYLYYFESKNQIEIAEKFNINRRTISRIICNELKIFKEKFKHLIEN